MSIVRGLKAINDYNAAQEQKKKDRDRPKTEFVKIADKQKVEIAFLQELSEDSPNFSKKNDLGILAVEHQNPENFRRKALCTMDEEGNCWACEQHRADYTLGWKGKTRLYINVLVKEEGKEPYVAVLSQSTSGQSITPTLIEEAGDEDTITTKWFAFTRNGEGTDTNYTIRARKEHGLNVEDFELFDLEQVVRHIPYDQQEAHYLDNAGAATTSNVATESTESAPTNAGDTSGSASVVW